MVRQFRFPIYHRMSANMMAGDNNSSFNKLLSGKVPPFDSGHGVATHSKIQTWVYFSVYTKRHVMRRVGRLRALAALATVFYEATGFEYFAGIFVTKSYEELGFQLSWTHLILESRVREFPGNGECTKHFTPPSWSWLYGSVPLNSPQTDVNVLGLRGFG